MSEPTATRWTDLPAPDDAASRWVLELSMRVWSHIFHKHLSNPVEPWSDWLGNALVERESAGALASIGSAARDSLARPLVLAYVAVAPPSRRRQSGGTWLLVLPVGALLVVREGLDGCRRVATAFFPRAACFEANADLRWRRVVQRLVWKHAVIDRAGRALVQPLADHIVPVPQEAIVRTRVRFLTPEQWGFATELHGTPWRGRLRPWTAPTELPAVPKRRLKPRYAREGTGD